MHRAFTSTFIVLALGVVIGAYIVLEPLSLENIAPIPTERGAAVVPVELASPTTPASPASIDEEVAKRLALEMAKAERLFLARMLPRWAIRKLPVARPRMREPRARPLFLPHPRSKTRFPPWLQRPRMPRPRTRRP